MGLLSGMEVAITGGALGIGLSVARRLHAEGARLAVCDIDPGALAATADELTGTLVAECDVSNTAEVAHFFGQVKDAWGGLDALVNNAGIAGPTGAVDIITPGDFEACVRVGLMGQFNCAHHAVPLIRSRGGGSIIGMSSVAGKYGYAFRTPYAAAKFGVIGLCQSLAKELGPHNIRVNGIAPGLVKTDFARALWEDDQRRGERESETPLRRLGDPEDLAGIAVYLASRAGAWTTGQTFVVDGGVTIAG